MLLQSAVIAIFCVFATNAEICTEDICEYEFEIRWLRTMTYAKLDGSGSYNVELDASNGSLKIVPNSMRVAGSDPLIGTYIEPEKVITAGGFIRNVITVNGQMPGPSIEVMEGAQVVVKVTNHLVTDAISFHWHGMYQQGTPWMDGVPYLSQCPIHPKQSFTYRFTAHPAGTHWYHSHLESQRVDGMYGMFIVHQQVPTIPQYTAMLQDLWEPQATTMHILNPFDIYFKGTGEMILNPDDREYSQDGVQLGNFDPRHFVTIINGRGKGQNGEPYPLEVFNVTSGNRIRMRVVHTGAEYPYYVSVDDHLIDIVASDGYELVPVSVNYITIHPGETMDFEMDADQPVDNYWMRIRSVRDGTGFDVTPDNHTYEGLAIVRYNGAAEEEPSTSDHDCNAGNRCNVFNCPFAGYGESYYRDCVTLNDVRSTMTQTELDSIYGVSDTDYDEVFFTFNFALGSVVNGKKFISPTVPLFQPFDDAIVDCNSVDCSSGCECTNIHELPHNRTIQLVMVNKQPDTDVFAHHPIHIHGHGFAVLKVGYPEYDETTGLWKEANHDVFCEDSLCYPARWNGSEPSDLNQEQPPLKDTISIPGRGYVVLRFRTDNPGFWVIHCHTEQHVVDGMAIVLNEAPDHHPSIPAGFPHCLNFDNTGETEDRNDNNDVVLSLSATIGAAIGFVILGSAIALASVAGIMVYKKQKSSPKVSPENSNPGNVNNSSSQGYTNQAFTISTGAD